MFPPYASSLTTRCSCENQGIGYSHEEPRFLVCGVTHYAIDRVQPQAFLQGLWSEHLCVGLLRKQSLFIFEYSEPGFKPLKHIRIEVGPK